MIYRFSAILALTALASCGGSGTTAFTTPVSDRGFATAQTTDSGGTTFTLTNEPLTVRLGGDAPEISAETVVIAFSDDKSTATLTLNGRQFALVQNTSDPNDYIFNDFTDFINFEIYDIRNFVSSAELFAVLDDEGEGVLNDGYIIFGFDTSPSVVRGLTGTARYAGEINFSVRRGDFDDAFGDGSFTLNADFANQRISGFATLEDRETNNADFSFETVTLRLAPTAIAGNGFAGDVSVATGDINGTLIDSGYSGRFYGPSAEEIGGTFFATVDTPDPENDTVFNGFFISD